MGASSGPGADEVYGRRYMSSASCVLIGFRASDAFVWCLIEGGLVLWVFLFVGFGLCLWLLLEAGLGADELNGMLMHAFCVRQFLFWCVDRIPGV